ncbi:MAG: hypothetical protein ACWA45_00435 [Flavobacteriales bacterium]
MKKIFYILILFFTSVTFAQVEEFCATPDRTNSDSVGVYSKSCDIVDLDSFETKTFNLFYWRINKSDGTYTSPSTALTPQKALQSVEALNEAYANLNICFNLIGMDWINSTAHHTGSSLGAINSYAQTNEYAKQNAFNVYVAYRLGQGSGQGSYNHTYLAVNDANIIGATIIHELGHNFNLIHTFGNSNLRPHPINCERFTRFETDPEYNADIAGDEVADTNAVPNFFREQHNHVAYAVEIADIGYSWYSARTQIAINENGFNNLTDATEIEQALIDYGFTEAEINHLKFNAAVNQAYTNPSNCSYNPDSRINDPNSPFFKDCGGTPYQVLEVDCRNYMSYYDSSCKNLFSTGQSIRAHEAIEDDLYGDFTLALSDISVDLFMQDTETDIGQEPNIHTSIFWTSEDIWVRNQNEGTVVQEHQNPVYEPNQPNYAYVRVQNKSCNSSSGNDQLKLYWAKANTALSWPLHWEGDLTVIDSEGQEVLMGDEIGTLDIPSISRGESAILEFEWPVPNPDDYMNINNDNPWHFCLLARIISNDDPITFPEETFITDNVKNNNNIAWKNLTIIEMDPGTPSPVGGIVAMGNFFYEPKEFTLEFTKENQEVGKPIYQEAEISITLDDVIYNTWDNGGKASENFNNTKDSTKIIVNNNYALIKNIQLAPNEIGTISVDFNFLTKELTNKSKFIYHLVQRDAITNKVIGGETFEIRKPVRPTFDADAGDDEEIEKNESITISAGEINEDATYNWYGPEGNLIYTGTDLSISPDITKTYKLEIVSNIDGFKDYDEIEVSIKPFRIETISPNPANNILNINYITTDATSAYVMLVNMNTGNSDNYILNTQQSNISIDVSTYTTGLYNIILVCDGVVQNSKTLLKE